MCGKCIPHMDDEKGAEWFGNPEGKILLRRPK
jgi:hypothetical protein